MELIKANPDIETLKLVLWLAAALISFLVVVIVRLISTYFTGQKQQMQEFKEKVDDLLGSIDGKHNEQFKAMVDIIESLKETVNELKRVVSVIEDRQKGDALACQQKHKSINNILQSHSNKINEIDKEIVVINKDIELIKGA